MNAGLDENEAKFGVFILSVALKVLANSNSLQINLVKTLLFVAMQKQFYEM